MKLANPTKFAHSLIRFFCEPGISSRTAKPASGAKSTMLSKCWSIVLSRYVISKESQRADHHEERIGLHSSGLHDAHRIGRKLDDERCQPHRPVHNPRVPPDGE